MASIIRHPRITHGTWTLRHARHDDRGGVLIEFAIVLPLLLGIMAGIVDFGRMFQRYEVVTNAAREGARIAVLPGYTQADVQARVQSYINEGITAGAGANATAVRQIVTITPTGGGEFQAAQVTVTYTDSYLILGPVMTLLGSPSGAFSTVTLTARSTMRLEISGS